MGARNTSAGPGPAGVPPRLAGRPIGGGRAWGWLTLAMAGAAMAGYVLWRHPPEGQVFYPRCLWLATTGWECPGCGGLRSLHALLHGNVMEAWRWNALLVGSMPLLGWALLWRALPRQQRNWPDPLTLPWLMGAYAGVVFGFGVGRNFW